jgi:anti-anti-sigma factor
MSSSAVEVEVLEISEGVVVAACHGEYDLSTRDEVDELLDRLIEGHELVVVDVSDAQYVDASFLNTLLRADELCRTLGKRFRLQSASVPTVRRALEYSGVLEKIEHGDTRGEVLGDLAG